MGDSAWGGRRGSLSTIRPAPAISLRVLVQEQQLLIELDSTDGPASSTTKRTPGWTRVEILGGLAPESWFPTIHREAEIVALDTLVGHIGTWPMHPTRLEMCGEGIDVGVVHLHTYTLVANEATSWGRVKVEYWVDPPPRSALPESLRLERAPALLVNAHR